MVSNVMGNTGPGGAPVWERKLGGDECNDDNSIGITSQDY